MAIDPHYIPAFSIEDVILDKDTGAPLSGGKVTFYRDDQRGTLKPVYQITGTDPNYTFAQLPNPVILSSIGTFEDSLGNPVIPYFYPYDAALNVQLYYVVVTSSDDVPQFVRQAQPFIPNSGGDVTVASAFANEISNPQFAEVLFDASLGSHTYSVNAVTDSVINFAPDWDLIVSAPAAGTVTLTQLRPAGSLNIVTNPGTILTISSSGLTKLQLRQRLLGSPNLWGSGNLAASFVAKTYSSTAVALNMFYSQSNGTVVDQQFLPAASLAASGAYGSFPGTALIPASNSSQTFPSAYIDIYFDIPLSIQIDITSIMVAFTGATSVNNISYDQQTLARQIDHLFHYYKPQLDFKPIPSYLTAWDFPLNPAQANGSSVAAPAVANAYTWDQTILFQSTVSRAATTRANNGAMVLTVTGGAAQIALIQYLPQAIARNMLESRLSVNVMGDTAQVGGLVGTVSLWYTTNASVPVLPLSLVTTLDANGKPSAVVAGWTEIARDTGFGNAQFTLIATLEDYGFSGWDLTQTNIPNTATYFAIVVGTASILNGGTLSFNSISVVPGDIPTIPAPQTLDQVLRESEYYFQKSFLQGTVPANSVGIGTGESLSLQVAGATTANSLGPIITFATPMRVAPGITFYNPAAANTNIRDITTGSDWSNSTTIYLTANGFATIGTTPGGSASTNRAAIHWTADARLGVV